MKWLNIFALLAITSCMACSPCFADDDFDVNTQTSLKIPTPSDQTPALLELTPNIPSDTSGLKAPDGQYKQLADTVIAEIHKQNPGVQVTAFLRESRQAVKPDLVLAYKGAEPTVVAYASNCEVNSQFKVQNVTLTALSDPDKYESSPDLAKHMLTAVCAHWTCLNHDWTVQEAVLPKKYKVSCHNGQLDISYDSQQVRAYNDRVAVTIRNHAVNIAKR